MSDNNGVYMLLTYGYSRSIFFIPEEDFEKAFKIKTETNGHKYVDMLVPEDIPLDHISQRTDSYLCNHELNHARSPYKTGCSYNMNISGMSLFQRKERPSGNGIYELRQYYAT